MGLTDKIREYFAPTKPLEPQMIHYRGEGSFEGLRMHLRIEPGGQGILVINASKVIHANITATEFIKAILEGQSEEAAVAQMRKRYAVDKQTALKDFRDVREKIKILSETDEICPVTYLGFGRVDPYSIPRTAPDRMDLALTYACDNDCAHCYVEREKSMQPLSLDQWKKVIDRLWDIGIPHICFTGGEATMSDHLVPLIEYAEETGIVTGLLTNGRRLSDKSFMNQLVTAGLDHVQITLESHIESIHDEMVGAPGAWKKTVEGIRNAEAETIYLLTNSTLCAKNRDSFLDTISFLKELGIENFACNGFINAGGAVGSNNEIAEDELPELLEAIRDRAVELDMNFTWYTPTQYCSCNPIELGLGMKRCTAGTSNMCIEPDGTVIPCQSYFESLGKFLETDWKQIWTHPTLVTIQKRQWVDEECKECDDLEVCGGGCPLYAKHHPEKCAKAE